MRLNKTSLSEQKLKEIFKIDETNKVLSDFIFDYLYNAKEIATLVKDNKSLYECVKEYYGFDKSFIKEIKDYHLDKNFTELDINKYLNNPYIKNIKINDLSYKNYKFKALQYNKYEGFLYDFVKVDNKYHEIILLGYFKDTFNYLALYKDDSIWMLITPHEINTMEKSISKAKGNVLTFGLGLGYYQYMVSLKDDVKSITIIENDQNVIDLFTKNILPLFKNKDKIKIIKDDAINFINNLKTSYDYYFVDLWHDVDDGLITYLQIIKVLKDKADYWIENSMIIMLRRCILTYLFEQIYQIENNYIDEESFYDHIINKIHELLKDYEINNMDDLTYLLTDKFINELKYKLL